MSQDPPSAASQTKPHWPSIGVTLCKQLRASLSTAQRSLVSSWYVAGLIENWRSLHFLAFRFVCDARFGLPYSFSAP